MNLAHLDMLIAYTVVMLGVSLIVTVLTQVVSAALGLRGTPLGNQSPAEDYRSGTGVARRSHPDTPDYFRFFAVEILRPA